VALDELERQFYETAKREGMDDAEIASRIRARRERSSSPYKPTNYAAEAAKLPSRAPEYEALMARGLSPEQAVDSVIHTDRVVAGRTPEQRSRDEDVYANDPLATMVLAGTLGMGAGALLGGAAHPILAGAANSATQTAVTGGSGNDIIESGAIGAFIPAAGAVLKKAGSAIRGSAGGQARALWEKHGGNVGPLDSGSGVEEIAGLEPSRANVGKASAIGARNIRRGMAEDFEKNVEAPYKAAREPVDYGQAGKEMTDVTSLIQTVGELPEALRPAIKRELQDLGAVMGEDGRVTMSQADLNVAKQRLQSLAKYGLNTGAGTGNIKDQSFKSLANAAKVLVDEGPYAEANDIYERGMNMQEVDRASLGLSTQPAKLLKGRMEENAKVAQILRNRNNDSEAAGAMAERADLPGFVSRHPELERQVDLPDLVRAKGKLEFGLNPDKLRNLNAKGENPTSLKRWKDLVGMNMDAFRGRYLYAPAGGAQAIGGVAQSAETNQILAALAAQRELEKRRAEALGR